MAHYHIWFATKKRRWLLQGEIAIRAKELLATVADQHSVHLEACETMVDHVHLLVNVPNSAALSNAVKLLKGRAAFELNRAFPDLKSDGSIDAIWQRGFKARLVSPSDLGIVRRYIQTQDERLEKYEY